MLDMEQQAAAADAVAEMPWLSRAAATPPRSPQARQEVVVHSEPDVQPHNSVLISATAPPPAEVEVAASSSVLDRRPGRSRATPVNAPEADKAQQFDAELGDAVVVGGRRGVISWSGLPEHAFAAVRWDDDGQESEPLPLDEMMKVQDGSAVVHSQGVSKAGVEARRGLPLLW